MRVVSLALGRVGERRPNSDQQRAEDKKADVPADRGAEIVPHVVDTEQLVVDQAFDDVEDSPAGEHHPDVGAPWWRQLSPLPRSNGQTQRRHDDDPGRKVKEPVRQGVRLESLHRIAGVGIGAGEYVVPLKDLVEDDPIDKASETETHQERRQFGRVGRRHIITRAWGLGIRRRYALTLGLLLGVLVGGELERAVEHVLKVSLLDWERPVDELTHACVAGSLV